MPTPLELEAVKWLDSKSIYTSYEKIPTLLYLNLSGRVKTQDDRIKLTKYIGLFTGLHLLYLNKNQLRSLPKEIGNLTNLEWLDLDNNPISENEKNRIKTLLPNTNISF